MLDSIFITQTAASFTLPQILICTFVSLFLGACVAWLYMRRSTYSKSFVLTLALLPAMVQIVIMMVNGNLGTGVAVMGAFSLIPFRSVPGTAREISSIFFAMALGLATGMGFVGYAVIFFVIIGGASLLFDISHFGEPKACERMIRITIPENLDYEGVFDDLFEEYTSFYELQQVRTTGMGSLFELRYRVRLRSPEVPKAFLDALRCRNGNLTIVCGRLSANKEEL